MEALCFHSARVPLGAENRSYVLSELNQLLLALSLQHNREYLQKKNISERCEFGNVVKVKANLFLCLIKHHAMNMNGGMDILVQLHVF
jgi:hypothetical protein